MADLLNIGLSGLSANKTALSVVGHNISNVNTPGFSRQETQQATRTPQFSGAGYLGSGTTLVDVRRAYNEFLTGQLRSSTGLSQDVETYLSQISELDSLLAGSATGVTPSLKSFFSAMQAASEDPANVPARQLVLSESEGLARRFNTLYDRMYRQNDFINAQLSTVTEQVNRLSSAIAGYNDAIAVAAANGSQPNDLLDVREESIRKLSELVGVTVVPQDDNTLNLFVGSGQPLVVGSKAARLEVVPGQSDPLRQEIQFVSGNSRQGVTTLLKNGQIGGLIRYREDVLDQSLNSLGRLALGVGDLINRQLGQGLDRNGAFGTSLFQSVNDAAIVGQRSVARLGNSDPAANLAVFIRSTGQLTTSDYEMEITGAAGQFSLRRLSDGSTFNGTLGKVPPDVFDGFSVELPSGLSTANFAAGDRFQILPTRIGASTLQAALKTPDQLAFAAPLKGSVNPGNVGTGTLSQPELLTAIDIADPAAKSALETSLRTTPPLRLLFTSNSSYDVLDKSGNVLSSQSIVPGQTNRQQITLGSGAGQFSFAITLGGVPRQGDSFSVTFNATGVSDNRNGLKLAALQSRATLGVDPAAPNTSGMSLTEGYGQLVERVGTFTAQARMDSEATGAMLKQAQDSRDSLSGVNLDEEAAKLVQFEQYYQASAQIIQVARSLFDTLINTF